MENAKNVGYAFIREYYGLIHCGNWEKLSEMYSAESTYIRCHKDETEAEVLGIGKDKIKPHLTSTRRSKFRLQHVDCVPSVKGSVLLSIKGTAGYIDGSSAEFHQTFVISPNFNAQGREVYYVHNDLLRVTAEQRPSQPPAPATPPPPPSPPQEPAYHKPSPPAPAQPAPEPEPQPPTEPLPVDEPEPQPTADDYIVDAVVGEAMDEPEEVAEPETQAVEPEPPVEEPQPPAPEPEEEEEAVEEAVEEKAAVPEPEEEEPVVIAKNMSYAAVLGVKSKTELKTQVLKGGAVQGVTKPKLAADDDKKRKPDNAVDRLIRGAKGSTNGKGTKGGKGSKGSKGSKDDAPRNALYVKGLPKDFSDADCEEVFGRFGKLSGKTIRSVEGYAFIDFESRASLDKALEKNRLSFKESTLQLQEKRAGRKGDDGHKGAATTRRERN